MRDELLSLLLLLWTIGGEDARLAGVNDVTGAGGYGVTDTGGYVVAGSAVCGDIGTIKLAVDSANVFVGFATEHAEQSSALRVTQGPGPPGPSPHPIPRDREPFCLRTAGQLRWSLLAPFWFLTPNIT